MKARYTIKELENCTSLEEAVRRLTDELRPSKGVYCQFHRLAPHGGFPVHKHLTTNEWTVIWDAEFDFVTRRRTTNSVQPISSFGRATVVHVPIGTSHTVLSKGSGFRYAVLKDGPDDFHPC